MADSPGADVCSLPVWDDDFLCENVAESFVEEKNAETESAAAIQQENEHEADVTDSEKSTEDVIDPEESSENSGITEEKKREKPHLHRKIQTRFFIE